MRQHHLISLILLGTLATIIGCAKQQPPPGPQMISGQAFVKRWEAPLANSRDPIKSLHVRENLVIAYTAGHNSFWLRANEGIFVRQHQIARDNRLIHPPVVLTDSIVIPTTNTIERFDKTGKFVTSHALSVAVQSGGTGWGNALYLGVTHAGSGRLARLNLTESGLSDPWEMYTTQGISSTPAALNDAVYVGTNDGKVWALTGSRDVLWNLPQGAFQTNGKISAGIMVDDYGVYVASQDKRLYCLERNSGRIRWSYYAVAPLLDTPYVTAEHVYQFVPNVGLVAINKLEGKFAREPMWIQPMARSVLATDETHVYVNAGGSIVALDKQTGEPQFRSTRTDYVAFATNPSGSTIYAATRGGSIMAIDPVLRPGTVGEIAGADWSKIERVVYLSAK